MGNPYWQHQVFKNELGHMCRLEAAPRYTAEYVREQIENTSHTEVMRQFQHWKETNENFEYAYLGRVQGYHVYRIYDEGRKEYSRRGGDVSDIVYSVLRNGPAPKPEPKEWDTGQPEEVWST